MFKKINVDDTIYYLKDNKLHSAPVISILRVETQPDAHLLAQTKEQLAFYMPFGKSRVRYSTCHGVFDEQEVFLTKKELAEDLIQD